MLLVLGACDEMPPSLDAGAPVDAGIDAAPSPPLVDAAVSDAGTDAGIDCGPHGDEHLGHCHCDSGYVFQGGTCMPIELCAGDDPFEPDDRWRDAAAYGGARVDRWLCPGDVDHVTIDLGVDQTLTAVARFAHAEVDLSLAIWEPGADPRFDSSVARTTGAGDEERLVYRAGSAGLHLIRISATTTGTQGAYDLELTTSADEVSP